MLKGFIFSLYKQVVRLLWGTNISKYSFVRNSSKFMLEKFKPTKVHLEGFDIYLDKKDILNLSTIGFKKSPHFGNLLKTKIRKNDIIVEVGSHIGTETLRMSKLVGDKGHVFAFEPEPKNFQLLKKNVEVNNLNNVSLINKAVLNENTEKFLSFGPDSASHKLIEKQNSEDSVLVKCTRLDDVTQKIDFAKIDAEGFDFHVLLGMGKLINNPDLRIIIEFQPKVLRRSGTDPVKMLEFLKENSFDIFDTEFNNGVLTSVTDFNKLTEKYSQVEPHNTDLFCIKNNGQSS